VKNFLPQNTNLLVVRKVSKTQLCVFQDKEAISECLSIKRNTDTQVSFLVLIGSKAIETEDVFRAVITRVYYEESLAFEKAKQMAKGNKGKPNCELENLAPRLIRMSNTPRKKHLKDTKIQQPIYNVFCIQRLYFKINEYFALLKITSVKRNVPMTASSRFGVVLHSKTGFLLEREKATV